MKRRQPWKIEFKNYEKEKISARRSSFFNLRIEEVFLFEEDES